jgi:hypothetical protein
VPTGAKTTSGRCCQQLGIVIYPPSSATF